MAEPDADGDAAEQTGASRLLVDTLAYLAARLALAAVLALVIYAVGRFISSDFPATVAVLFAIVLAFPLGIWVFAPLRRRATASIAAFDARRRRDRDELRSRLRGEDPPES